MRATNFNVSSRRLLFYWGCVGLGLFVVVWQFFTFLAVVEAHTAQAQKISQSAGWAGKAVGVMRQPERDAHLMAVSHHEAINIGMMRADWP